MIHAEEMQGERDVEPLTEALPEPAERDESTGEGEDPWRSRPLALWGLGLSAALVIAAVSQVASSQAETGFFLLSLTFVVCSAAALSDVARRRIPNTLTYPAILLGLALNVLAPLVLERLGARSAVIWLGASNDSLLGFGLCALVGIVSFVARGLGGGDVKLLAACGALLGFHSVVAVLFNTLVVAALIGVANWAAGGSLVARIQVVANNLFVALVTKRGLRTVYTFQPTEGPFALSLLIGLTLAQFFAIHRVLFSVGW